MTSAREPQQPFVAAYVVPAAGRFWSAWRYGSCVFLALLFLAPSIMEPGWQTACFTAVMWGLVAGLAYMHRYEARHENDRVELDRMRITYRPAHGRSLTLRWDEVSEVTESSFPSAVVLRCDKRDETMRVPYGLFHGRDELAELLHWQCFWVRAPSGDRRRLPQTFHSSRLIPGVMGCLFLVMSLIAVRAFRADRPILACVPLGFAVVATWGAPTSLKVTERGLLVRYGWRWRRYALDRIEGVHLSADHVTVIARRAAPGVRDGRGGRISAGVSALRRTLRTLAPLVTGSVFAFWPPREGLLAMYDVLLSATAPTGHQGEMEGQTQQGAQ